MTDPIGKLDINNQADSQDTVSESKPKDSKSVTKYLTLIEKFWDDIGACRSCGWHDSFSEYEQIIREDLELGLDEIELLCHSKDDEDAMYSHRGVKFRVNDLVKQDPGAKDDSL
jgi:hypothetical protein